MFQLWGETNQAHTYASVLLLRGIGPIEFVVSAFEGRVIRLELAEALVDGSVIRPISTKVTPLTLGQLKKSLID